MTYTNIRKSNRVETEDIRVHVNNRQRELLEFLVTRRLNDVAAKRSAPDSDTEVVDLAGLKRELQHAGT